MEKQVRSYEIGKEATEKKAVGTSMSTGKTKEIRKKLWYCKQCGYVVFREDPPYVCPICKAKREMFAELVIDVEERE
jgi:rubrerythrin